MTPAMNLVTYFAGSHLYTRRLRPCVDVDRWAARHGYEVVAVKFEPEGAF